MHGGDQHGEGLSPLRIVVGAARVDGRVGSIHDNSEDKPMMIRRYLHRLENGRYAMLPWPPLPLTTAYAPANDDVAAPS